MRILLVIILIGGNVSAKSILDSSAPSDATSKTDIGNPQAEAEVDFEINKVSPGAHILKGSSPNLQTPFDAPEKGKKANLSPSSSESKSSSGY